MAADPIVFAQKRVEFINSLNKSDLNWANRTSAELAVSDNNIVDFFDLPVETQDCLKLRYRNYLGKVVNSATGPRHCGASGCSCLLYVKIGYMPTGPVCPRTHRLKTYLKEGDPLFIVYEDGQIKKVEYKKE